METSATLGVQRQANLGSATQAAPDRPLPLIAHWNALSDTLAASPLASFQKKVLLGISPLQKGH